MAVTEEGGRALLNPRWANARFWGHPGLLGHTSNTAGTFRRKLGKVPEKPRKRSQSVSWNSLESTAGIPQALLLKAFEASRAFPEFYPPLYGWGRLFFQKWFRRGPLRAGHGIPSSTEGYVQGCGFFAYCWKLPSYSGAFLLTVDNFSFFAYSWSFFAYSFSFFAYSWSFLLTVGECV